MIIYKVTNKINGKVYIGQTTRTLEKRKWQHLNLARRGHNNHFYNAIRKYGEDNFTWEVLCDGIDNKELLNQLERYYITKFDSIKNGYNMIDNDYVSVMDIPSVKRHHKQVVSSEEVRKHISDGMKKYRAEHPFTEEHRRRLSESAMGNHNFGNPDTRSIGCFCVDENGNEKHFHSYRDAWKWWSIVDNPFDTKAECVYQRKIKQSILNGSYTYRQKTFQYPKWYKEGGDKDEKVTDSDTLCHDV